MTQQLSGNLLVAQSGGPTAVINATLAGVITQALNYEEIAEIYGGLNGIQGILEENFIDLAAESQQTIRALMYTPGSALGTCRYKVQAKDFDRIIEVFQAHNIRYFFYIGGNDSQDTTHKIAQAAKEKGYDLRILGLPKTIDNDLPITDHCPGYGSAIKYIASTVREMAKDHEGMGQHDLVSIVEVMGRTAGWIAAGSILARRKGHPEDAPHIICLPECPFSEEIFLKQVKAVLETNKYCLVVTSEGLVDANGNYIGASATKDAFGHAHLGGIGDYLKNLVEEKLKIKARSAKLGTVQRSAAHLASKTDRDEAFLCGQTGVKLAIEGHTDKMLTLIRGDTSHYTCEIGTTSLESVANEVKLIPPSWINEDGSLNNNFIRYAFPLIQGEITVPFASGLPEMAQLDMNFVPKKL